VFWCSAAYEVSVEDSWPEPQFTVVDGLKTASFDQIPAYVSLSSLSLVTQALRSDSGGWLFDGDSGGVRWLNQTLVPTFDGEFQGFEASVQYKARESDAEPQLTKSTPLRTMTFLTEELFTKVTAKHTVRRALHLTPLFRTLCSAVVLIVWWCGGCCSASGPCSR
jgi:hypothetical protein